MTIFTGILFGIVIVLFILYDIQVNKRAERLGDRLDDETAEWEKAKEALNR